MRYLKSILLLLISAKLLYLSTIPSRLSAVGEDQKLASHKKAIAFEGNFIATPH